MVAVLVVWCVWTVTEGLSRSLARAYVGACVRSPVGPRPALVPTE